MLCVELCRIYKITCYLFNGKYYTQTFKTERKKNVYCASNFQRTYHVTLYAVKEE